MAAFGISLVSALALLAPVSWLLELLTHFRVQYLAVQLALLLLLAWRRDWRLGAFCVPFMLVNLNAVADYWPRTPAALAAGPDLELLTVNLNGRNRDHARFVELARRENPDVLVLLEVDAAWAMALEALAADYPERLVVARADLFGIAVLSRHPLLEPRVIDLRGAPAIDTRISLADGRELRMLGVHLRPPTSAARAGQRNGQLADLRTLLEGDAGPVIVTGDFNVTPYSPLLSQWLESTGLVDARRGRGFRATWPTSVAVLGIPIDHCLISEHFRVGKHYQGAAFGSDHYPVLTQLSLRAS